MAWIRHCIHKLEFTNSHHVTLFTHPFKLTIPEYQTACCPFTITSLAGIRLLTTGLVKQVGPYYETAGTENPF
jgi:hypothetical protein